MTDRETLIVGLNQLRQAHYTCEDCWYSCPKCDEGCCNDTVDQTECSCGADQVNALIDELLALPLLAIRRHEFVQNPRNPDEVDCEICGVMRDLHGHENIRALLEAPTKERR